MEAQVFVESDINKLLDTDVSFIPKRTAITTAMIAPLCSRVRGTSLLSHTAFGSSARQKLEHDLLSQGADAEPVPELEFDQTLGS